MEFLLVNIVETVRDITGISSMTDRTMVFWMVSLFKFLPRGGVA